MDAPITNKVEANLAHIYAIQDFQKCPNTRYYEMSSVSKLKTPEQQKSLLKVA